MMNVLLNFDFKRMIYTNYMAFYKFLMKLRVTFELKHQTLKLSVFFFKRDTCPCRYLNLIHRLARPVPELRIINNIILKFPYERWGNLITTKNQKYPNNLQIFADAIHDKGVSLESCWRFVDEAVRLICRSGENQRIMYNNQCFKIPICCST